MTILLVLVLAEHYLSMAGLALLSCIDVDVVILATGTHEKCGKLWVTLYNNTLIKDVKIVSHDFIFRVCDTTPTHVRVTTLLS